MGRSECKSKMESNLTQEHMARVKGKPELHRPLRLVRLWRREGRIRVEFSFFFIPLAPPGERVGVRGIPPHFGEATRPEPVEGGGWEGFCGACNGEDGKNIELLGDVPVS